MTHASLFSGIGAPDLAAQKMGWENVFHCEINPFGQTVLKDYWPNSISYEDIKTTDFSIHRGGVDVLTGGFPCQPYSQAGLRKGKEDERHLWPEMRRAIREVQPPWVVGENVRGITNWNKGLVFEEVCTELEAEGYEVQTFILPAAGVDAPHRRDRVFFIAYSASYRRSFKGERFEVENREKKSEFKGELERRSEGLCVSGAFTNTNFNPSNIRGADSVRQEQNKTFRRDLLIQSERSSEIGIASNSNNQRIQRRSAPEHTAVSGTFGKEHTGGYNKSDYWSEFPTQSAVCDGNDGLPYESLRQRIREDSLGYLSEKEIDKILSKSYNKWREETIKAGGNAIVHQVIHQIFKAIEQYENL